MQFWRGVLAMLNTWTGDHRRIEALSWREPPLTLRYQREDNGGHSNAIPCGTIDRIWIDGDRVMGEGSFSENPDGAYAVGVVGDQSLRGVSIDPGAVSGRDVVIAADGAIVDIDEWFMYPAGAEPWPGPFEFGTIYDEYEIAAATLVATPAFAEAAIEMTDTAPEGAAPATGERIAASSARLSVAVAVSPASMILGRPAEAPGKPAAPAPHLGLSLAPARARLVASDVFRPPVDAFRPRSFAGYEPFAIDDETRVISGHAYPWAGTHRGFRQTYVRPPQSRNFTEFLTGGTVTTDDGSTFHVGVLTHLGGHFATLAEYDRAREDPANQLGPVVLYADECGVQVCGVVWPDVPAAELARAKASFPSGDWNWVGGEQLLTGIALVNNPGYHAFEQDGVEVRRLVASFAGAKAGVDPSARARLSPQALADLAALDEWDRRRRSR